MVMKRETDASGNTKYGHNYKLRSVLVRGMVLVRVLPGFVEYLKVSFCFGSARHKVATLPLPSC